MKKIELVVSKQNNVDTIRYDLGAADVYDDRAADKAAQLNNIIPFQYSDEDGKRAITSYVHEDMNLETFIKSVHGKKEVLCVLSGLVSVFEVGTQGIPVSYIVKDTNYIYVNKETLAVKAVLVAVKQDVMALAEIPAFFRDIISKMKFSDEDRDNYVARLITLINSNDFSVSKLKEMLNVQLESMGLFISRDNGLMNISAGGNAAPAKEIKVNKLGVMNNMRPQQPYGMAPMGMAPQMPQGQPPMGMAPQMPQGQPPMGMAPQMPQGQPPMGAAPQGQPNPMAPKPMGQPSMGQPPMGAAPQGQPNPTAPKPMGQPLMGGQPPMGAVPQGQPNSTAPKPMGQPLMGGQPPMGAAPQGQPNPTVPKPMGQPPMGQPPMGAAPQGQPNPTAPKPMGQPPMGAAPQGQSNPTALNPTAPKPQGQPPMGAAPQGQPNPMAPKPMGQPPIGAAPQGQPNPMAPKPMGQPSMGAAPQGQPNPTAPKPMGQPPMGAAPQGHINPTAPIMMNSVKPLEEGQAQPPVANGEKQEGIMGNLVGQLGTKPIPHLVRKKTGEAINITKSEFTIGKSKTKADYAIENNTAISRVHCIIVQRDGVNYIKDNNSTNHTYIDGVELTPGKEVLLKNKMTIQLGDEEFTFLLRKGE